MRLFLLFFSFAVLIPNISSAKKIGGLFGKEENIKEIMALEGKGPNGEEVYLAYKTTGIFFFMGAYLSDDGYVLGIRGTSGSYYPLDENQIKTFQENGFFPTPLPQYEIPFVDWFWGFALWILLAVIAILWFLPIGGDSFAKGCKYYFGKETPVNYNKAHRFFQKSASKGYAPAQYNLGIMYLNGQGVAKDVQKAISNFMLASDQNYANAQFQIGNLYFKGQEIPKDLDRALSFYTSACNNGNQDGCKMVNHINGIVTSQKKSNE